MEETRNKNIVGVILAAGKGSRIAQLPSRLPKTALPILGEPIIFHQLRTMVSLGIRKCYVVVGYLGFEVVREIVQIPNPGIEIEYVEQKEALGIAHCVGCLEPYINDPFMLFLGDIYFQAPRIAEMLEVFSRGDIHGVLGAIEEKNIEAIKRNFCIVADESHKVRRVIEKPKQPISDLKGVGVYLFDTTIFEAIKCTPRTAMRNEYEITHSIQLFIDNGYHVLVSLCIDKDLNLTYPEDLLSINLKLLKEKGDANLVCEGARVGIGSELHHTIVGRGANIGKNCLLDNCVVFGGASVGDGKKLTNSIITDVDVYNVQNRSHI